MRIMPCNELIDFLADYLDGKLDLSTRAEFEYHLTLCPPCVDYLKTYQDTIRLTRESSAESEAGETAPTPPEDLVQAILNARRAKS